MEKKLIGIDEFIFVKPDKLKQLAKNVMLAIGCSEIAASDIAKKPKMLEVLNILLEFPAKPAIIAPTIITDEIAFVTDIKGV